MHVCADILRRLSKTVAYVELPHRPKGDQLVRSGELTAFRHRLRGIAPQHDVATVIAARLISRDTPPEYTFCRCGGHRVGAEVSRDTPPEYTFIAPWDQPLYAEVSRDTPPEYTDFSYLLTIIIAEVSRDTPPEYTV